jgi:hypothetical protein
LILIFLTSSSSLSLFGSYAFEFLGNVRRKALYYCTHTCIQKKCIFFVAVNFSAKTLPDYIQFANYQKGGALQ